MMEGETTLVSFPSFFFFWLLYSVTSNLHRTEKLVVDIRSPVECRVRTQYPASQQFNDFINDTVVLESL